MGQNAEDKFARETRPSCFLSALYVVYCEHTMAVHPLEASSYVEDSEVVAVTDCTGGDRFLATLPEILYLADWAQAYEGIVGIGFAAQRCR